MAFFKVNFSEENVKDYNGDGGKWLNKSGMYDIIIKSVIVDTTANGSEHLNLLVDYEGQEQTIYQAVRLTNNDGSANLGAKLFTKLCAVIGATNGGEIADPVAKSLPIGKNKEMVDCMVLEEFDNAPVTIHLRMEYLMYDGKVKENKVIRNFFRFEDKATASEITNNSEEIGKQFVIEQEFADKVTYKDELTAEDVVEWKKSQRSGKKETTDNKPKAGFGQKRTFGKSK